MATRIADYWACPIAVGALALSIALTAGAEERTLESGLDEVVVTAQKREESLQDTPISIIALSSDDLETRGITNLVDLQADVPSLSLSPHPQSATTVRVFMRGIGIINDLISYDPSVAIYLDGVYVARFQGLASEVADIERIEVLRGPQGALYGRNSTGGAINFVTRAPTLNKFSFRQDFSAGNYDLMQARSRVNIPISETFAAELSFFRARKDGFIRNVGTGVSRFGDQDRHAYRAALLWRPHGPIELRYTYDRSELNDTPVYLANVPLYPAQGRRPSYGLAGQHDLVATDGVGQGHNLTASLQVSDALTLRSITGYRELANFSDRPQHAGVQAPPPLNATSVDLTQHQFSQEVQAIGTALDDRLQYIAGLYWFDEGASTNELNRRPLVPDRTQRHLTANNKSYAAYSQATYTPVMLQGRMHLTVGGRWTRDERQASKYSITTLGSGVALPAQAGEAKRTFSDFSPSAVLAFDVTDDINAYGKVATGYKTGGFNLFASSIARMQEGFGPESVTSYELGVKSTWFANRLRVNAALFKAEYKDLQLSVTSDPTNISISDVLNAGKSSVDGLELDVMARPVQSLKLSLAYAWLDGGYDRIIDAAGRNLTSTYGFVETPKHKLSSWIEYTMPRTRLGVPSVVLSYAYQAERVGSTSCKACVIKGYGLFDTRLTFSDIPAGRGSLRFSVWGRNLTDETYYTSYYRGVASLLTAVFGDPRSYGADLSFEF